MTYKTKSVAHSLVPSRFRLVASSSLKATKGIILLRRLFANLLALAVILTSATALRIPNSPVGPGEILLCAWLIFILFDIVICRHSRLSLLAVEIWLFWTCSIVLMCSGWLIRSSLEVSESSSFHDAAAYTVVFAISFGAAQRLTPQLAYDFMQSVIWLSGVSLFSLLIAQFYFPGVLPISMWYQGDVLRFSGWSSNPNQTALLICPMPFFSLYAFVRCNSVLWSVVYFILCIFFIILGKLTGSDALLFAWGVSGSIIVLHSWLRIIRQTHAPYWLSVSSKILGPLVITTGVIFLWTVMGEVLSQRIEFIINSGNQASDRITLWTHGIEAILASPIVGLGPGAFSGIESPFLNTEAHNSFIDWGTNTGMIGILLLVLAIGYAFFRVRSHSFLLSGTVISLVIFSLFHHVLRQPLFWIFIITCIGISSASKQN